MPSLTVDLNESLLKALKLRAKKNLLTPKEQAEDIIQRSMLSYKAQGTLSDHKIDDSLVSIFSRQRHGNRKKKR